MSQKMIFDIIMSLNNLFGIFLVIRFYHSFLGIKHITKLRQVITIIISLFFSTILNIITTSLDLSLFIAFALYLTIALLNYQGKLHIKMIVSIFVIIFSVVTELLAALAFIPIFNLKIQNIRDNLLFMFLGGMVSNLLLMLILEVIGRIISRKVSRVSTSLWILIITIPMISIYISVTSVYESVLSNHFSLKAVLLCVSILYINLIVFYLFDSIITQIDKNNQGRFREEQLVMQQKQYQNILFGYEQVKKIRHDMLNHLIALDGYMENGSYQKAEMYIAKLHGELDHSVREIISGNVIVDALINNKKKEMATNEINFVAEAILPKKINIDDMDLCIILGNALDNAFEACRRIDEKDVRKEIHLTMKYKKENLLFDLRNSYNTTTINNIGGIYHSAKEKRKINSIGMGIANMISIVEKYEGTLDTEIKSDYFELRMLIPDKKSIQA